MEWGCTYPQVVVARYKNHLSKENLKTLFLLAALKLPVKNQYEYEQEMKLVEGKL